MEILGNTLFSQKPKKISIYFIPFSKCVFVFNRFSKFSIYENASLVISVFTVWLRQASDSPSSHLRLPAAIINIPVFLQ